MPIQFEPNRRSARQLCRILCRAVARLAFFPCLAQGVPLLPGELFTLASTGDFALSPGKTNGAASFRIALDWGACCVAAVDLGRAETWSVIA